ncbi:hypothetical protein K1719_005199 [Acacia pycnantha]|nr:hypothetical protein K1719_005199 [Acacia pycnantha]
MSKSGVKRDETQVTYESNKLNVHRKELLEGQGSVHVATIPPLEQFQRPRQSKSNRALNDERKMKAAREKMVKNHNYVDSTRLSLLDLNFGDSSRGEFCGSNTLIFKSTYNVHVIVGENELEDRLLNKFRRFILIEECKHRGFFEAVKHNCRRESGLVKLFPRVYSVAIIRFSPVPSSSSFSNSKSFMYLNSGGLKMCNSL